MAASLRGRSCTRVFCASFVAMGTLTQEAPVLPDRGGAPLFGLSPDGGRSLSSLSECESVVNPSDTPVLPLPPDCAMVAVDGLRMINPLLYYFG